MVEVPFEARVLVGESSCLLESSLLSLGDSLIRRNQDLLYASSAGSAPSPNIMIKSAEISIMAQQSRLRKHVGGCKPYLFVQNVDAILVVKVMSAGNATFGKCHRKVTRRQ